MKDRELTSYVEKALETVNKKIRTQETARIKRQQTYHHPMKSEGKKGSRISRKILLSRYTSL